MLWYFNLIVAFKTIYVFICILFYILFISI